jgi:hypothetical protein
MSRLLHISYSKYWKDSENNPITESCLNNISATIESDMSGLNPITGELVTISGKWVYWQYKQESIQQAFLFRGGRLDIVSNDNLSFDTALELAFRLGATLQDDNGKIILQPSLIDRINKLEKKVIPYMNRLPIVLIPAIIIYVVLNRYLFNN